MKQTNTDIIKIVILGVLPPPYGGPEVMIQTLINGLSQRPEFQIKHINTQVSHSLAEKGGRHQFRKMFPALKQTLQLLNKLVIFKPDIVYLTLTNSPSFFGFLRDALFLVPAIFFRNKIVIQFYGGYYFYAHMTGLKHHFVRILLKNVKLALVEGERLTSAFNGLVPRENVELVRHGRDGSFFEEAIARKNAKVHDSLRPKRVLFVGLMCKEKGFRDLVAAIPFVPEAHFIFAGEWPSEEEEKEVLQFLKLHGVENRVSFVGVVSGENYFDLVASGDVLVLPSKFIYEGQSVATVDALAAGLPIICTDHGALNESVRDGWNGFFVPKSDPAAIARRLNQLLSDDDLRRTMGERSRQLYEERFTLPQYVENWSEAILRCAAI